MSDGSDLIEAAAGPSADLDAVALAALDATACGESSYLPLK